MLVFIFSHGIFKMCFDSLPNELLIATFNWLPSYAHTVGVNRVCCSWRDLTRYMLKEKIKQRFPFLTDIESLSAAELSKISDRIESICFFIEAVEELPLAILLNFLENGTISDSFSDKAKVVLRNFAAASNLLPLDEDFDKEEVFTYAAALGNKKKLVVLNEKEEISIEKKRNAFNLAAVCGQLACLQYLDSENIHLQNKKSRSKSTIYDYAFLYASGSPSVLVESLLPFLKWDSLPCLKYLIDKHADSISSRTIKDAIRSTCKSDDHFPSFKYLYEMKKDFLIGHMKFLLKESSPVCKQYLIDKEPSRCTLF